MHGIYDLTLAAGAVPQNIAALGQLVKVVSAPSGAVKVRLDGGEQFTLLEGQGIRLADGVLFRDLQVTNASGVAQQVLLFVGDSRFEDTRITGTVSVIDSAKDRTRAGQSFLDYRFAASTAALSGVIQVWNPVGSGKRLVVVGCSSTFSVAGVLNFGLSTVMAPNSFGNLKSKLSGGAAAASSLKTDQTAAPGSYGSVSSAQAVSANTPFDWKFRDPLVCVPGSGVVVYNDVGPVGTVFSTFDCIEEANT